MLLFYLSLLDTPQAKSCFQRIYAKYHDKLLSIACSMLHDQAMAEDAVHDTFVKIIHHFEKFSEIPCKKQESWIVTILKNTIRDMLRKKKRIADFDSEDFLRTIPDPRQEVEAEFAYHLLRDAIRRLSPDDQELLEWKLVMEWTDREIAHALRISPNAVSVRIHRAKGRLRKLLEEEGY